MKSEQDSPRPDDVSRRDVVEALRNLRRRYAVYYLKQHECGARLGELATQIAAWERESSRARVPARHRKSVYSALHQTHLPRLERVGLVEYDRTEMRTELTELARDMELYLAADRYTTQTWSRRYLVGSFVAATVGVLWVTGIHPISTVPVAVWLAVIVVAFAALSLVHFYTHTRWIRRFETGPPDCLIEFDDE